MYNLHSKLRKVLEKSVSIDRLMLFDLSIYGHHPEYIQYLLNYWHQKKLSGQIIVLVSPRFLLEHADVVQLGQQLDPENIQFFPISQEEEDSLKPRNNSLNRNLRNFQEWFIFCRYAKRLKIDHALLMYYDTYQYPLALRLNPPCPVSGIYFRPKFHYKFFAHLPAGYSDIQVRWEKMLLNLVLSNSKLRTLFTIDPFVVKYLKQKLENPKLLYLPDPVQVHQYSQDQLNQVKDSLNIDSNRKLFLLFGALTDRKGIYQLLDSIPFLPEEICSTIAIALIGETSEEHQYRIESRIARLTSRYPIEIYRKYEFLPEELVQAYFEVSDFILALYQRHVGMSGILNLAAAKQKPVLSSDYGLMGELVKQYHLGLTVDSTDPRVIALGIEKILSSIFSDKDLVKMQKFTDQNSASQFAPTIFKRLLQNFQ
ncbi:MAG: glycosyltransferase [Xenococcus sp. MO_188.B8]|nr:glycosyltransferase [Xenococcus sp. MO_188.B8]